jgi:hypothetical protein
MTRVVTESAMIERINRKLDKEGQKLHKADTAAGDLGRFYIVDVATNSVAAQGMDSLDALAVEVGALYPGETLEQ